MSPYDIAGAILNENAATLSRTPGIGKKIASRIILELKGKLKDAWLESTAIGMTESNTDVLAALTALVIP
jgi:Holliday junction DNA helicase RuvA